MIKIRQVFSRLLQSNRFLKIFSLVLAFIVWIVVVMFIDPKDTQSIKNVTIDLESQSATLSKLGFNIISAEPREVSVEVYGKRYVLTQLKPEDIKIQPRLTTVSGAGTQDMQLQWISNGSEEYIVNSISPPITTVRVDRLGSKTLDIEAHVTGASVAAGYIKEDEVVTPERVVLTGPVNDLNRVAHAIASVQIDKTLSATENVTSEITLVDSDGVEIDSVHIQKDYETAQISVPVLKIKDVPLKIGFLHTPTGFPLSELAYTLSNNSIRVAGPQTLVDGYDEIRLGFVDFRNLELGAKEVFDVELPSGFDNVDNILSVSVEFDMEGYTTQSFNIDDIGIVNAPQNYEVRIISPTLSNVKMVGNSETLTEMGGSDLIAEIDFSDREVVTGQIKMPVSVYAPNKGAVWAVGDYIALVEISERE